MVGYRPSMTSAVRFDHEIFVSYGFIYLDSGVGGWDGDLDQRAGESNGLAGAYQDGFVCLTTGTNTGSVPLRVEEHQNEPRPTRPGRGGGGVLRLWGLRSRVVAFDGPIDDCPWRRTAPTGCAMPPVGSTPTKRLPGRSESAISCSSGRRR